MLVIFSRRDYVRFFSLLCPNWVNQPCLNFGGNARTSSFIALRTGGATLGYWLRTRGASDCNETQTLIENL